MTDSQPSKTAKPKVCARCCGRGYHYTDPQQGGKVVTPHELEGGTFAFWDFQRIYMTRRPCRCAGIRRKRVKAGG